MFFLIKKLPSLRVNLLSYFLTKFLKFIYYFLSLFCFCFFIYDFDNGRDKYD
jgi:hypothetical protein